MKHYYSILAHATTSEQYEAHRIFIEPGINAFTVLTDDVEALVAELKRDGIHIDKVTQLDGPALQDLGDVGSRSDPSTSTS